MPKTKPEIVEIPSMNYIAIRGKGNPRKTKAENCKTVIRYPEKNSQSKGTNRAL